MANLRAFFVLWSGQAVSLLGSQAVQFALIWWLTAETGSAAVLAMASVAGLVPHIALGPFIGALVDRWNRKRVMLAADTLVAAASVLLAVLFLNGIVAVPHILVLLFVRSVGGAFHSAAMMASTSLMVPERHLTRIQGLNQSAQGGQLIISAPLGALLVATMPMAAVMLVDVVSALVAIIPLVFIHVPQPAASERTSEATGVRRTLRDVREGLQYLLDRRGHTSLLAMASVVNLCMVPGLSLLPLLVLEQGGGPGRLGGMNSLFGVGTIVGGIALGIWGGFKRRIYTTMAGLFAAGAATVALGQAASITGAFAAIGALGLAIPLVNGPIQAILQATVPAGLQGRIFTLYGSLCGIMTPLGLALAAPLADRFGVRLWYLAGGLACAAMAACGLLTPAVRAIEGQPQTGRADSAQGAVG